MRIQYSVLQLPIPHRYTVVILISDYLLNVLHKGILSVGATRDRGHQIFFYSIDGLLIQLLWEVVS